MDAGRRMRGDLVRLMARCATVAALVLALDPEEVATIQTRALEHPVCRVDDAVRRARHHAGPGEHDAEEAGLGDAGDIVKPAVVTLGDQAGIAILDDHPRRAV